MRTIDELFSEIPQKTLYHYTGIGGLMGIVESRTLWASHIYYLNDAAEITHARNVLRRLVSKRKDGAEEDEKEFLGQLHDWLETFSVSAYHLFIFALTEEGNLLSQWRSYTPHGKGVSIGFSPSFLLCKIRQQSLRIAKCLYEPQEQEELMASLLEKMLITYHRERNSINSSKFHPAQKYYDLLEKFRGEILQVFAIIKHSSFREEREWRIISPYYPKYTIPQIKFRDGASMLVPYIEIDIGSDSSETPLFERVYLGPTQHVNLSISALSNFLSNKGVCNETVDSRIPYREW